MLDTNIIEVCAKNINADYIISRDEGFAGIAAEVKIINSGEFVSMFK